MRMRSALILALLFFAGCASPLRARVSAVPYLAARISPAFLAAVDRRLLASRDWEKVKRGVLLAAHQGTPSGVPLFLESDAARQDWGRWQWIACGEQQVPPGEGLHRLAAHAEARRASLWFSLAPRVVSPLGSKGLVLLQLRAGGAGDAPIALFARTAREHADSILREVAREMGVRLEQLRSRVRITSRFGAQAWVRFGRSEGAKPER